jgi:hypothetical protein
LVKLTGANPGDVLSLTGVPVTVEKSLLGRRGALERGIRRFRGELLRRVGPPHKDLVHEEVVEVVGGDFDLEFRSQDRRDLSDGYVMSRKIS